VLPSSLLLTLPFPPPVDCAHFRSFIYLGVLLFLGYDIYLLHVYLLDQWVNCLGTYLLSLARTMKFLQLSSALLAASCAHASVIERRQSGGGIEDGQPIDGDKGAPILGMLLLVVSYFDVTTFCQLATLNT
jgi:hypothetical protein